MWEIFKDIVRFIEGLIAKRKASFVAMVKCHHTINGKGKIQSQFTLVIKNVGKSCAKNIEITSADIYLIFNKHFKIVSTEMTIQSPITLVTSNPDNNFNIDISWNDGRKQRQNATLTANIEYE